MRLVEGRLTEALALAREGLATSEETSPAFAGPILLGLLALLERHPGDGCSPCGGRGLVGKGGCRPQPLLVPQICDRTGAQRAGLGRRRSPRQRARSAHPADEPLLCPDLIVGQGRILARIGRGAATEEDERTLADLRIKTAQAGFRIDALGEALRAG